MTRRRSLNVHNTDRLFNLNLTTRNRENKFTKVTAINEDEIADDMDELKRISGRYNKRDNNQYMIYKQRYSNDSIQEKVINHGGFIYYYTTDRVPIPVISKLAGVPNSEVIYYCQRDYTAEDVKNIQLASMATRVTIDVPIVLPDINPYDYLFALYPLRYHVDKVKISFPTLQEDEIQDRHEKFYEKVNGEYQLKSKYKYKCFNHLHEPLSTWKMNLWLTCDSQADLKRVEDMVVRDNKRFKRTNKSENKASIQGGTI